MGSTLVRGKWVLSGSGQNLRVIKNGAVLIENDTIRDVGQYEKLRGSGGYDLELGSDNSVVMPGLINAHNHGRGLSAFQGGVSDAPLELWLLDLFNSYTTDLYWDTLLAAMNMISMGTTTVLCHWCERDPAEESYRDEAEKSINAFLKSGMRVAFAPVIYDQHRYSYFEEESLLSKLPREAKQVTDHHKEDPARTSRYFDVFDQLSRKYRDRNDRVNLQYGPNGVQWCTEGLLREIAGRMERNHARAHLHLLETKYQMMYGNLVLGKSMVSHLNDVGLLNASVSLAHCVWLDERDIGLLSDSRAICIHNPSSNLRLHSGISPLVPMLERGVRVGLGTDSTGLNDEDDLIQEMRLCWLLHRLPGLDAHSPSSTDVFRMATSVGAEATGFGGMTGCIEVGKKADLALLDARRAVSPFASSRIPILDLLLQRITKSDVETVVIDGRVVYDNGHFAELNREEVIEKLMNSFADLQSGNLGLPNDLKGLLREHFSGFIKGEDHGHYRYNPIQN